MAIVHYKSDEMLFIFFSLCFGNIQGKTVLKRLSMLGRNWDGPNYVNNSLGGEQKHDQF